jgi:chorismate mutase
MPHPRLLELRQQIDALDSQLQELLIQRTALTQQVGS